MTAVELLSAAALFTGSSLLLSGVRFLRRTPRHERVADYIAPFLSGPGSGGPQRIVVAGEAGHGNQHSPAQRFVSVLSPVAVTLGNRLARAGGIHQGLEGRLQAAGRPDDVVQFRTSQFTTALVVLGLAGLVVLSLGTSAAVSAALLVGAPAIALLAPEQALEGAIQRRRDRLEDELPLVAEQLGVLMASGMSLGTALDRIAARGNGVAAREIAIAQVQVRRGTAQIDALKAFAERLHSASAERLVGVLSMHRETRDVGPLLATEARSMRESAQRRLIETIERRAQLVWIPVTVATLVPGLILIGIPFVSAMSRIAG